MTAASRGCALMVAMAVATAARAVAAPPGAGALPTTSLASPDVIGIKVGTSTLDDVRRILGEPSRGLGTEELSSELRGQSTAGRAFAQPVVIPNGKYVSQVRAVSAAFRDRDPNCSIGNIGMLGKGDCETVTVEFSGPPDAGTVLAVRRIIVFATSPSLQNTEQGLVAKYGAPGFHSSYGDRGVEQSYYWGWDATGRAMSLNARHPCATPGAVTIMTDMSRREAKAKTFLEAGCAAVVSAILNVDNGVVKLLRVHAIDHVRVHTAMAKTRELVTGAVGESERREREKAAAGGAPEL